MNQGLYSKGKALLEAEKAKADFEPLEKAKKELELIVQELKQTPNLSQNIQWIDSVSSIVQKVLVDYDTVKAELKARLDGLELEQKAELRVSLLEVLRKSNNIDSTFKDIKILLSQIFKAVTADAELKRRTLENINAELNR